MGLAPQRINCPVDIFGHCLVPDGHGGGRSCTADGSGIPCDMIPGLINSGAAIGCPNNHCSLVHDPTGWHPPLRTGPDGQWQVYVPGYSYYFPALSDSGDPIPAYGIANGGWTDLSPISGLDPGMPTSPDYSTWLGAFARSLFSMEELFGWIQGGRLLSPIRRGSI